jgi:hypothetical protein
MNALQSQTVTPLSSLMKNAGGLNCSAATPNAGRHFGVAKARNSLSYPLTEHYMSGCAHKIWLFEKPPKGLRRQMILP